MAGQGATVFGLSGPCLLPDEAAFFAEAQPWAFILFARNVETPDQLRALTSDLRAAVGREACVMIDQEGGRVARLGPPHWRSWRPPLDQVARAGANARRSLYLRYRLIADELNALGIDVNCAPCADIARPETHPVLRNRCLGSDAVTVARNARAVADGLLAGGVLPVVKHIPGHGRARLDSHKALPHVTADVATLSSNDFMPFRALSDLPLGMSAHIVYDVLDSTAPATTSARMCALVRDDIGFDGLMMSDDISMQALSGDVASRSRAALTAGVDLVLHCNGDLAEMQAIAAVAGPMSRAARTRASRALSLRKSPGLIDIDALEAELEALLGDTTEKEADGGRF